MTTPANTVKKGGARFYVDPVTNDEAIGVTSVLNNLPKPFLAFWRAKVVAESAFDGFGALADFVQRGDRDAAIDWLKRAPGRSTGNSATIGTDVHDLCERIAKGENVDPVHPDLQPYVDGFKAFIAEFKPEFLFLEQTVWSEKHGYAGSFDAIAKIDGQTVIIDWKTTKSGVHAEVALQLAAYANADYILNEDGTRTDLPKIDAAAVVHLRPDKWGLHPIRHGDPDLMETFLSLMTVGTWEKQGSKKTVGKAQQSL